MELQPQDLIYSKGSTGFEQERSEDSNEEYEEEGQEVDPEELESREI